MKTTTNDGASASINEAVNVTVEAVSLNEIDSLKLAITNYNIGEIKAENNAHTLFNLCRTHYKKGTKETASVAFTTIKGLIASDNDLSDNVKKRANGINSVAFDFATNGIIVKSDNLYYSTIADVSKTITTVQKRSEAGALPFTNFMHSVDAKGKAKKSVVSIEQLTQAELVARLKNKLSPVFVEGVSVKDYSNAIGKVLNEFRQSCGIIEIDDAFVFIDEQTKIVKAIEAGKMSHADIQALMSTLSGLLATSKIA